MFLNFFKNIGIFVPKMKLQFESWQFIFGARIFLTVRDLNLESISVLLILKKVKKIFSQSFWQFDQR